MARPLVVRVGDLLREPGSARDLDRHVDLPSIEASGAATIPGVDVDLVGVVHAMAGGVEVTGTVGFDWYGGCRRCLDDVTGHLDVGFREVAQREPVDEEVFPIDGDLLDLEPLVRELILASLPVAPLCREDCAGPDPDRFPTAPEPDAEATPGSQGASGDDEGPARDPRWAALDALEFDR